MPVQYSHKTFKIESFASFPLLMATNCSKAYRVPFYTCPLWSIDWWRLFCFFVFRSFSKFTGNILWRVFLRVVELQPATILKKKLPQRCFLVNFAKPLRKPFKQNTSGELFLCCVFRMFFYNFGIKKSVWMIFLYFRSCSCKVIL